MPLHEILYNLMSYPAMFIYTKMHLYHMLSGNLRNYPNNDQKKFNYEIIFQLLQNHFHLLQ